MMVFAWTDNINWEYGIALAIGNAMGGWWSAKFVYLNGGLSACGRCGLPRLRAPSPPRSGAAASAPRRGGDARRRI